MSKEQRCLQYLDALGIRVWKLRKPPAVDRGETDPVAPVSTESESMPLDRDGTIARMDWTQLEETVVQCQACTLGETRTQTVFGTGSPRATLMVVGEAPGAEEDLKGEPFVGRAGHLLDQMLRAMGLDRQQVYIANVIKCRPPNNRNPHVQEIDACLPFLARQIELIQPELLLVLGGVAAHTMLETTEAVGRLRGRWHRWGPQGIPLLVTYHPAYLLRSPVQKGRAWEDLQRVVKELRTLG